MGTESSIVCLLDLSQGRQNAVLSSTCWCSSTWSPPPWALSLSKGVSLPGRTSLRGAVGCCAVLVSQQGQPCSLIPGCLHCSSIWAAAAVMLGAALREAVAFCWVDIITPWSEGAELSAPYLACPAMQITMWAIMPCCGWRAMLQATVTHVCFFYSSGCCQPGNILISSASPTRVSGRSLCNPEARLAREKALTVQQVMRTWKAMSTDSLHQTLFLGPLDRYVNYFNLFGLLPCTSQIKGRTECLLQETLQPKLQQSHWCCSKRVTF